MPITSVLVDGASVPYDASRPLPVSVATADGGAAPATDVSRIVSAAATTNDTSAKASAGYLHQASGYNAAGAARYLKIYDKASAPTVGTDTPVLTLYLPASSSFVFDFPALYFATGIAYALTTGSADADTGALTAGDVLALNVVYG